MSARSRPKEFPAKDETDAQRKNACLTVFQIVAFFRPAQIILGLLAVFIGSIHVKDFFTLHKGISLSIPEAAKPGIYSRARRIVTAEACSAR